MTAQLRPYLALGLGIGAVSFAAILIRKAEAPSLVIAAYRLTLASLVLAPFALVRARGEFSRFSRREWGFSAAAGAFLALHFATWVTSLQFTSVASSVALVTTAPMWVALASFALWGQRPRRVTTLGIALAVIGSALIGGGSFALGGDAWVGDALALAGAWAGAGYFMLGRSLRARASLLAYIAPVYTVAALLLIALALAARQPLGGYPPTTYLLFAALAFGPQLLGHSSFNYALKFLSATFVTVVILGEPVGSSLLAVFLLNEIPPPIVVAGGLLVLAGIALVARGEPTARQPAAP
ncbi:MAG: DMT family transporter [Chloroflexi bacterium]|nr:DMT family transporter [Chloroflexota bacterium]